MLVYQRFLASPEPTQRRVMAAGPKPSRNSPDWRPFAGPLSPTSARQALSLFKSLFSWVVEAGEAGFLTGYPLALVRCTRLHRAPRLTRFLPMAHRLEVGRTIQSLPASTARERAHTARSRAVVYAALHRRHAHFGGLRWKNGRLLLSAWFRWQGARVARNHWQG